MLLPLFFDSPDHSNSSQPAEPQSTPLSPRERLFNSTALIAPAQDARASLSRAIDTKPIDTNRHRKLYSGTLEDRSILFRTQLYHHLRLVISVTAIEVQPVEIH